jgi:hypothetical protein
VEDGVTGLLVPPRDVPALRTAIERLLDDAELRGRLGVAARASASNRFSWAAATAATVEAYRKAISARADEPTSLVATLTDQERAWNERPLLRRLYKDWFEEIASWMSSAPGSRSNSDRGSGAFGTSVRRSETTDVEPTPWAARSSGPKLPYRDAGSRTSC